MELNAFWISLPAVVALLFKGGIYFYAHFSKNHSWQTRFYLLFLFALSIQNIAEISGFHTLYGKGVIPHLEATVFYASSIIAIALLLHLAVSVSLNDKSAKWSLALAFTYLYAAVLEVLLIATPLLISDFVRSGYLVTRVPGPLFFAFEWYAIAAFAAVMGLLIYGLKTQETSLKRARCSLLL